MQVIVNSLLTSYTKAGTGKRTLLLLHGWADAGKTFEMLTKQLDDFTVIAVDLPGFGGTQAPAKVWGIEEYAEFVEAFTQKIGIKPYSIIGHSNGGAIAIYGLAQGILKADRLVLIASAGVRSSSAKKTALRMLAKPAKLAIKATPKSTQRRIRRKLYTAIGSDYLIAEHLEETFKRVVAKDVTADAAKLTLPTILIYGEDDEATPVAYGKTFEKNIKGSKLHVITPSGHFVHQEQVYKVAGLIKEFLA